jgi:hypothetical protein
MSVETGLIYFQYIPSWLILILSLFSNALSSAEVI